jgi:hypothetical protein
MCPLLKRIVKFCGNVIEKLALATINLTLVIMMADIGENRFKMQIKVTFEPVKIFMTGGSDSGRLR